MKSAGATMNIFTRKGRRTSDSPIDGIKEFVDRARSATPLRLVRKNFAPVDSQPTDENVGGSVWENNGRTYHESSVYASESGHSEVSCSESEHVPKQTEQVAASQTAELCQHSTNNIINERYTTNPRLSPDRNEVFMFPSQSQSSDILTPQHLAQSRSASLGVAETGAVENIEPHSLTATQLDKKQLLITEREPSNCAVETTNDRIDEDMLSAWWFLGSRSDESFGFASDRKRKVEHEPKATKINEVVNSAMNKTDSSEGLIKRNHTGSISTWILRSFSSEKTHSLIVKGGSLPSNNVLDTSQRTSHSHSQDNKQTNGAVKKVSSFISKQQTNPHHKGEDYTRKELAKRREWLLGLGGTVNYDQPYGGDCDSVASYQLYPHPKDNLQINTALSIREDPNKSPDWDPSMLPKQKPPTFEDWTPQDSSYGAAVPVCGCIPKRIRKLIEIVFVLFVTALIIFLVVKLGIKLTANEHKSSSGTDLSLWSDDDHYIANGANNDGNLDDAVDRHDDGVYKREGQERLRRRKV
jgi:hypothetical protein